MKVIIIDHEPFSDRKKDHYYIEQFLLENEEVEYWDVSGALVYNKHVTYSYRKNEKYVRIFTDYKTLLKSIDELDVKTTTIILEAFFRKGTHQLFRKIRGRGIKWVRVNYYHNPTSILGDRLTLNQKINKAFNLKFIWGKINRLILNQKKYATPDLLFLTGAMGTDDNKILSIDFFDVEEYQKLEIMGENTICKKPYIVFLDIMFSNHPDFQRLGVTTIDGGEYFKKMRSFFDKIEKRFNMPVVIASHPKANYNKEFGDRMILKDVTGQLVKDSELVITHGSLSISYALLASKPLLYLYFDEMLFGKTLPVYYRRMVLACNMLGASLVNVIEDMEHFDWPKVDNEKYDFFLKEVYLKASNDHRSNYEIIRDSCWALATR